MVCPPAFVTTTETAALVVLTGTEPKLSAAGLIPMPAFTDDGKITQLTKIKFNDR
jgi:hypothetical protein